MAASKTQRMSNRDGADEQVHKIKVGKCMTVSIQIKTRCTDGGDSKKKSGKALASSSSGATMTTMSGVSPVGTGGGGGEVEINITITND